MTREDYGRLMDGYTVESSIKVYSKIGEEATDEISTGSETYGVTKESELADTTYSVTKTTGRLR